MRQAIEPTGSRSQAAGDSTISALGWAADQIHYDHGVSLYVDGVVNLRDLFPSIEQADRPDLYRQLIRLYKRVGVRVLDRLRGSYAIAIWDSESRRLLMAVDPFGTRTLFYSSVGNAFAFTPRLPALMSWDKFQSEIDPNTIYFYLNHAFCQIGRASCRERV